MDRAASAEADDWNWWLYIRIQHAISGRFLKFRLLKAYDTAH